MLGNNCQNLFFLVPRRSFANIPKYSQTDCCFLFFLGGFFVNKWEVRKPVSEVEHNQYEPEIPAAPPVPLSVVWQPPWII